jgi:hypothetical protein
MTTSGFPTNGALPANITTSTSTQIKTGQGILFGLSVNTGASGAAIALYDGTSTAGTKLGAFSAAAQGYVIYPVGIQFLVGLFAVTTGSPAADVTVTYY